MVHKTLLPFTGLDGGGVILAFLAVFVASGVGMGGGGILVPIYTLMLAFSPQRAIPLSNITIFGGSIVNVAIYLYKRHPKANRPLIDWDLILAMEPLTILGAILGSFVNKITPGWITSVCLVIVLSVTTFRQIKKGIARYRTESSKLGYTDALGSLKVPMGGASSAVLDTDRRGDVNGKETGELELKLEGEEDIGLGEPGVSPDFAETDQKGASNIEGGGTSIAIMQVEDGMESEHGRKTSIDEMLDTILQEESQIPPWYKILAIIGLFASVLALTMGRLGTPCGTPAYWIVTCVVVPVVLCVIYFVRRYLMLRHKRKVVSGYKFAEGEVRWNSKTTLIYPSICGLAGLIAGMFGIGGGIIKNPLMIEMNVLPDVAVATSATMIFFTTGSASFSYLAFGSLQLDYGGLFFAVGFLATLCGQPTLKWAVKKMQRKSLIIFIIAGIIAVSTVLMTVASVFAILNAKGNSNLCGAAE
mmetsp:Transcript_2664/g.3858  ORF Transcript_2664/g.3858 Transcript_2664/m.3858 type:complete len:474 (-) Transcript_2664:181-1602(-)|eukprot:CAMPEP_0167761694 /NCGR_PEP_ID=MMETSP0110_2-20121227/12321_1 /TAXON_ID=629695 /ORGANISM="Gymnochlora sp., Strain CCMP2014" /LENGTH=473 /DNA_ID=CAMNT_0007648419 /DNA_START=120 /DNA_END=1541 /DNA_ORIENTATION=-